MGRCVDLNEDALIQMATIWIQRPGSRVVMSNARSVLPGMDDVPSDFVHTHSMFDLGEDKWAVSAHLFGVTSHNGEVGADGWSQVGFVNDEEIGLRDARAAFAGNLVSARNINDLNRVIGQFAAETGGQVIPARFQKQKVGTEFGLKILQSEQVGGDIVPDGGVRAAPGFDRSNAFRGQRLIPHQEFAVFLGENIIGHGRQIQPVPQPQAKLQHERGLSAAHRSPDSHGERPLPKIAVQGRISFREMAGMIEMFVGMTMLDRAMSVRVRMGLAHIRGRSALKKPRIEAVMSCLIKV